ncbi:hypothetical protein [endosymbiont DhMRE of Dentiscutata heterogama]|uniref:hypothetical protein n=1 Tax=endosymbiont DhMRE of Dentiscutata heterogama TaxID=1609546 RepID=UPI002AD4DB1B|nr:hypothetical protein [endosymbiont DhMRE of Dentiscutata heterogama]
MSKFQKSVFSKLYRYYVRKLVSRIGIVLLYLALFTVYIWALSSSGKASLEEPSRAKHFLADIPIDTLQQKLVLFWVVSLIQLGFLLIAMTPLISWLVGRGLGWEELKAKKLFSIPKIRRDEDVKVTLFTPGTNRETMILAKFVAAFTWFMGINLLTTTGFFIYFLVATKIGVASTSLFLLLNGVGFVLINFLFLVPLLFYQQEVSSFLFTLIMGFSIGVLFGVGYFFWETILQYPLVFISLSIPLSILTGWIFFSLYWKKYLKNDLE